MKLYAVRVFTHDWEKAFAFYKDTLELPVKFEAADIGWAEFDIGGPSLGLERMDSEDKNSEHLVGRFVGISLQVDAIEEVHKKLVERGVTFLSPPEKQEWGGVLAHFFDPDRNILTLLGDA